MPNEGFIMSIKANNGNIVPLYPSTVPDQILGWNIGEVYGPYILNLLASGWNNNQQTVSLSGISSTDIPICTKVLTGSQAEMQEQDESYSLLNSLIGINSGNNKITFTCNSTPTVDFSVSVSWTR